MEAGPMFLFPGPFRPIPMYGPRPLLNLNRFPPVIPPTFHPYLNSAAWKIDDVRLPVDVYNTGSHLATYNLYIQEHLKRLQETRIVPPHVQDLSQTLISDSSTTSTLAVRKDALSLPHPLNLAQCSSDAKEKTSPGTSRYGETLAAQYSMGRKVFPCPQCRYTTDRRNNLKRHMLTMHQTCPKLLECCGILFSTKASLREHAMIFHYHGYSCFYCGRRFCRKALLKRHLSVHNGQKDFVCSVCDYATSHKSNLERHRKVHLRQDDTADEITSDASSLRNTAGNEHIPSTESGDVEDNNSESSDSDDEEINVHCD